MSLAPSCPRCAGPLKAPDIWSSAWRCEAHGEVLPYATAPRVHADAVAHVLAKAQVPVWVPLPLLPGWTVTGLGHAGDDRTGARAVAVALSGPSPLGGPADMVLVAEEMGVGLGARIAGMPGPDPGDCTDGPAAAKVEAAGHPTALWACPAGPDRAAFVGEARGLWLWAVLWPPAAELVLLEHVELHDLREHAGLELPFGAPTDHLSAPPVS